MTTKSFTENEIRPDKLMEGQQIASSIDLGRLLLHSDKFLRVNCPACDSGHYKPKYKKFSLTFVECDNCETIFTNPRPPEEVLEKFYKESVNYEYWSKYIFPATENVRRQKIFVPRVDKTIEFAEKYCLKMDSILEIGAAFGTFCIEMQSRKIFAKIAAVEPTPALAANLRMKGINVIEDAIENITPKEEEKFDVVVSFEVIEHVFSPEAFLKKCSQFLNPQGLLIITCPNGKGFDFEELGEKCGNLDHEHLTYFNTDSLPLLLSRCGFTVLEVLTPGRLDAELVRKKILSGEHSVIDQPFLRNVLLNNWEQLGEKFQDFLVSAGLSSSLWVISRKS